MQNEIEIVRCVTPQSDNNDDYNDDEIPHLLKPNPSDCDEEEDCDKEVDQMDVHLVQHHLQQLRLLELGPGDQESSCGKYQHQFLVYGVPSNYATSDGMMDASPVSSISGYTRGDRSISASGLNRLLPFVSFSSEISVNTGISNHSRGSAPRGSESQSRSQSNPRSSRKNKKNKKDASKKTRHDRGNGRHRRTTTSPTPLQGSYTLSRLLQRSSPVLKLKPRMERGLTNIEPISPLQISVRSASPIQDGWASSPRSSRPPLLQQPHLQLQHPYPSASLKGRESSPHSLSSRPPPSPVSPMYTKRSMVNSHVHIHSTSTRSFGSSGPTASSLRRSSSLNLSSRRNQEDSRVTLGTLNEGRRQSYGQRSIPSMPINYSPRSSHRRTSSAYSFGGTWASTCSKSSRARSANTSASDCAHRRTVSFPDDVMQRQSPSTNPGPDPIQHLYPYNDFTLESDDPALFSLVSATQVRSNGRVFIARDVDPVLVSPGIPSLQSTSGGSSSTTCIEPKSKGEDLAKAKSDRSLRKHRRVKSTAGIHPRDPKKKRGGQRRTKSFDPSCLESSDMPEFKASRQIIQDELRWKEPSPELILSENLSSTAGRPFHFISNCIEEIERIGSCEEEVEFKRVYVDGSVNTIMVSSTEANSIDDAANLIHKSRSQLGKAFRRRKVKHEEDSCIIQ